MKVIIRVKRSLDSTEAEWWTDDDTVIFEVSRKYYKKLRKRAEKLFGEVHMAWVD